MINAVDDSFPVGENNPATDPSTAVSGVVQGASVPANVRNTWLGAPFGSNRIPAAPSGEWSNPSNPSSNSVKSNPAVPPGFLIVHGPFVPCFSEHPK